MDQDLGWGDLPLDKEYDINRPRRSRRNKKKQKEPVFPADDDPIAYYGYGIESSDQEDEKEEKVILYHVPEDDMREFLKWARPEGHPAPSDKQILELCQSFTSRRYHTHTEMNIQIERLRYIFEYAKRRRHEPKSATDVAAIDQVLRCLGKEVFNVFPPEESKKDNWRLLCEWMKSQGAPESKRARTLCECVYALKHLLPGGSIFSPFVEAASTIALIFAKYDQTCEKVKQKLEQMCTTPVNLGWYMTLSLREKHYKESGLEIWQAVKSLWENTKFIEEEMMKDPENAEKIVPFGRIYARLDQLVNLLNEWEIHTASDEQLTAWAKERQELVDKEPGLVKWVRNFDKIVDLTESN